MSLQDDLTAVRRNLNELVRSVERLEQDLGRAAPGGTTGTPVQQRAATPGPMVPIPDTPYDSALWTDSDDEGLGARDRHAP
ncbi:hypothetical protein [Streptomyces sp. NPDC006879]|uniref:hypothetical protein n=1 Tax=Streptomyces sp. NPDC006879 TaxID=3364767 RepID=UPI0036A9BC2C